jgi:hypothetical protein
VTFREVLVDQAHCHVLVIGQFAAIAACVCALYRMSSPLMILAAHGIQIAFIESSGNKGAGIARP